MRAGSPASRSSRSATFPSGSSTSGPRMSAFPAARRIQVPRSASSTIAAGGSASRTTWVTSRSRYPGLSGTTTRPRRSAAT